MAQREVTIRLEDELVAIYEKTSKHSGTTVNALIDDALRFYAKEYCLALGHELSSIPVHQPIKM